MKNKDLNIFEIDDYFLALCSFGAFDPAYDFNHVCDAYKNKNSSAISHIPYSFLFLP